MLLGLSLRASHLYISTSEATPSAVSEAGEQEAGVSLGLLRSQALRLHHPVAAMSAHRDFITFLILASGAKELSAASSSLCLEGRKRAIPSTSTPILAKGSQG